MTFDASIDGFRPGDLLFFRGYDRLSNAIAIHTRQWWQWPWRPLWSHVAICADVPMEHGEVHTVLFESTTFNDRPCIIHKKPIAGVQAHYPHIRVKHYPGDVWRLRLSRALKTAENSDLAEFLLGELGKPYDYQRAEFLAAPRWWWDNAAMEPTPDDRFCSELAGEGLKIVGRINPEHDCESLSPNGLGMLMLHSGNVWALGPRSQSRQIGWRKAA